MKNFLKLNLTGITFLLIMASCGANTGNNGSTEANTSDSAKMDTPMTTGSGTDTLQNTGGTEVDNTQNPIPPKQNQNQ